MFGYIQKYSYWKCIGMPRLLRFGKYLEVFKNIRKHLEIWGNLQNYSGQIGIPRCALIRKYSTIFGNIRHRTGEPCATPPKDPVHTGNSGATKRGHLNGHQQ